MRVKTVLEGLLGFKKTLGENEAKYLIIKVHKVPLSTTAFVIDCYQSKECRILLDYKVYNGNRESSYGIEYQDSERIITKKALDSYIAITESAHEIAGINEIKELLSWLSFSTKELIILGLSPQIWENHEPKLVKST